MTDSKPDNGAQGDLFPSAPPVRAPILPTAGQPDLFGVDPDDPFGIRADNEEKEER